MVRYILLLAVTAFMAISCAPQKPAPTKADEYLPELVKLKKLTSDQIRENVEIKNSYEEKTEVIFQIAKQDSEETKALVQKKEKVSRVESELLSEIYEAIQDDEVKELMKDSSVADLVNKAGSEKEVIELLKKNTNLSDKEIQKIAKFKKLQIEIASAEDTDELKAILKKNTNLSEKALSKMVEKKEHLVQKKQELKFDVLAKIYDRLKRNRKLGIDQAFCSRSSDIDKLIVTPIHYDLNSYIISKGKSNKLFNEINFIYDESQKYKDMILQIEGNCDERGSNGYNKALGERRWTGVKPLLTAQTFDEEEVRGISKGEECLTEKKSDLNAWWQENRRSDFIWVLR